MSKQRKRAILGFSIYAAIVVFISSIVTKPNSHDISLVQEASISPVEGIDYRVDAPLIVRVDAEIFVVPKDFKTGLASIPRWLWSVIAPNEADYVYPSILHDYLYSLPSIHSRQFVDDVFYSFLRERGVSRLKAYQFYLGVRIFGEHHFVTESGISDE